MRSAIVLGALGWLSLLPFGCGDDEGSGAQGTGTAGSGGPVDTGAACEVSADCYPGVADPTTIEGEVLCLDQVRGGYCTHTCESDEDCCAAEGECEAETAVLCSPFESTGMMMCFLSCEEEDLVAAEGQSGPVDEQEYCQREAGRDFICRSSGGGNENRKVCVPGDCGVGAECAGTADCAADLDCIADLSGGYCSLTGCTTNADCPNDSSCVMHEGASYCFRNCTAGTDCSFCRTAAVAADCRDDVEYVEAGTTGSVCVP